MPRCQRRAQADGQLVGGAAVRARRVRVGAVVKEQGDDRRDAVHLDGCRQRWDGRRALVRLAELPGVEQVVGVGARVEQEFHTRGVAGAERCGQGRCVSDVRCVGQHQAQAFVIERRQVQRVVIVGTRAALEQ